MSEVTAVCDRLRDQFGMALERAYEMNDVLAAFWLYACQLADFESRASGIEDSQSITSGALLSLRSIDSQSIARGGLLEEELKQITEIAGECRTMGLSRTADSLALFRAVLESIAADPPKECWCAHKIEELICNACAHKARYFVWELANTKIRPDLREQARGGRLRGEARCYVCDNLIQKSHFFYCDPGRDEFLVFWPYGPEVDSEKVVQMCADFLAATPLELRDGKSQIAFVDAAPPVIFQQQEVAAIVLCRFDEEFDRVVNDDMLFYVEPTSNMDAMIDYFVAQRLLGDEKWLPAIGALARSFLKDPVRVSFLGNIASCLKNLGRGDEADVIVQEAIRLRDILMKHGIIKRVVRKSAGNDPGGLALNERILSEGLPPDWGFADMLTRLKAMAEYGEAGKK